MERRCECSPFARVVVTDAKPTTVAGCNWDIDFEDGLATLEVIAAHRVSAVHYKHLADRKVLSPRDPQR